MLNNDISVIICTYNGYSKGFICEAVRSVYAQTLQPKEIILVDDGSSDSTLEKVLLEFPMLIVRSQENKGPSAARNVGINLSTGSWIAFLDDDDVWLPSKLEKQLAQAVVSKNPTRTIFASRMATFSSSKDQPKQKMVAVPCDRTEWPLSLISTPVIGPSGVFLSRTALLAIGYFNENLRIGEDFEFWARATRSNIEIEYSKELLFYYRIHHLQATASQKLLDTILNSENSILPLTRTLDNPLASKIRWIRFFLGLRAVLRRASLGLTVRLVRSFPFPDVRYIHVGMLYVLFEIFCIMIGREKTVNVRKRILKRTLSKRSIRVFLMGGLGNQMFQYAAASEFASRNNRRIVLDVSFFRIPSPTGVSRPFELANFKLPRECSIEELGLFWFRILNWTLARIPKQLRAHLGVVFEPNAYAPPNDSCRDPSLLIGYFQHCKYFESCGEEIRYVFNSLGAIGDRAKDMIEKIRCSENSVCIHVRRGDYVSHKGSSDFHGALSLEYYENAIIELRQSLHPEMPNYFIFSDDIEWCAMNLATTSEATFVEAEGMNSTETLHVMSQCKHFIIANSTFSWWAAWLGRRSGGHVIIPKMWTKNLKTSETGILL